jgi:hypothetical protein|tara:strand:+ start:527 stop:709 length:183 start_codon:yes stop_codon:yes gene_type:complete
MKKRITYRHETDATRTLEVVGEEHVMPSGEHEQDRTYIKRIDDYVVDFPTANIFTETVIG